MLSGVKMEFFMNYIPNPLLYGVSEDFFSSFKLVITMRSEVQHQALANAVLKTLNDLGLIESRKARVQILLTDSQGSIVCTLRNASEHEKNVFAAAVA